MVRKRENIQWAAVVWMNMSCWCQRRMDRLVIDDRKTTVTQITTRYNQGMKNTISEHTTHRTLKQMGSSSRRPHRVPLLSDKNSTQRIQFTPDQQNWTIEDWKHVAWSDESWFLLQHSDVGSESGVKNMKAWIILPCLNGSGCWWWCNDVGDIFLANLEPIEHRLNTTVYLSIVADHVHPFMTTVYHLLMYFQQDNASCHKAQIISDWFLEHDNDFTLLKWPPQSPDLNPIEHLWDVVEREIHIMDVQTTNLQQLCDAIMSIWTKISEECFQHLVESMPRRINAVLKAKGVQPGTSKVYLIKWPVCVCTSLPSTHILASNTITVYSISILYLCACVRACVRVWDTSCHVLSNTATNRNARAVYCCYGYLLRRTLLFASIYLVASDTLAV